MNIHAKIENLYDRWAAPSDEEPDERQGDLLRKDAPAALWVDDDSWLEAEIERRPWIAPGYLMRGAVTVVSGPGSAGKSSLLVGWSIALALGRRWHRFCPAEPMKVFNYNVEDDRLEQQRRMSATLRQFDASPRDLAGKVVRIGPNSTGTLLRRDPITGRLAFTASMRMLEKMLEERRPDVLILDPLVELHDAEENDNTAIRAVMAKFRALAIQYQMAVVLIHHARKGAGSSAGDPDSLRGASSIVGAARVVLTVLSMDEEQAGKLGINSKDRTRYFRVDGAKSNYAPLHEAEWFQRIEYQLDNEEGVAAAVPWEPPSAFGDLTSSLLNTALDQIAAGPTPGILYSPSKRGGSSRWCGQVLMDVADMEEPRARQSVAQWLESGLLHKTTFHHPELRRDVPGVLVDNAKRPTE
jgi:hypothetical protein